MPSRTPSPDICMTTIRIGPTGHIHLKLPFKSDTKQASLYEFKLYFVIKLSVKVQLVIILLTRLINLNYNFLNTIPKVI